MANVDFKFQKTVSATIAVAAEAVRKAHQHMRDDGATAQDIEAMRWHEAKLWELCLEANNKEAGQ